MKKYILLIRLRKSFKMSVLPGLTHAQQRVYEAKLPEVSELPGGLQTFHSLLAYAMRDPVDARREMNSGIGIHGPGGFCSAVLAVLDALGPVVPIPSDAASPDEDKQLA